MFLQAYLLHFAIWDKYILQFGTNTFGNLRQIHLINFKQIIFWNRLGRLVSSQLDFIQDKKPVYSEKCKEIERI